MRIHLDLRDECGKDASLTFEEQLTNYVPISSKVEIEEDLRVLLRVFSGLAIAALEDAIDVAARSGRPVLLREIIDHIERFLLEKLDFAQEDP